MTGGFYYSERWDLMKASEPRNRAARWLFEAKAPCYGKPVASVGTVPNP